MDRLPALIAACAALGCVSGCERADGGGDPDPASGRARVAAVPAAEDTRTLEDLCDVLPSSTETGSAPEFAYPALSPESGTPPAEGWRWINLWATWCKPCVEEIPMLREWSADLAAAGSPLEIVFLSVDESAEAIADYLQQYPDAPSDYRVADPAAVPAWLEDLGLAGGGSVPVHVVVDADDRVRCVRGGKVAPRDFSLVERLLSTR
jgi:thiol-disulfide isomerase/thioredoxin